MEQGLAVILVSSELPEVMNLAHRTIVMRRGVQVAEFGRGVHAEDIVAAASGLGQPPQPVAKNDSEYPCMELTEVAA